ncbi:MAG: hypothetical protein GY820_00295 [Gammaproteobacteria bacterium]|nr:hypothetical protein [Gammaproteobacteria bacterium]
MRKMKTDDAPMISDMVMGGLLQIMQRSSDKEAGGVMEDALLAVSTLIEGTVAAEFELFKYTSDSFLRDYRADLRLIDDILKKL